MNRHRCVAVIGAALLGVAARCSGDVPGVMNYQGRVVLDGTNFEGTAQFKFALVDGASGGSYWSNGTSAVSLSVAKGLFSTVLGDTNRPGMSTPIPTAAFDHSDVRLRVWFSPTGTVFQQLSPDQRVTASGYSIMAATVQNGAITSGKLSVGAVQSSHIAAGAIQPYHLAAGAADSYDALTSRLGVSPNEAAPFTALQAVTTNGGTVSITCRVDGESLGIVEGFLGTERLCGGYSYRVSLVSDTPELPADSYIGQDAMLVFRRHGTQTFFDGMVSKFGLSGFDGRNARYVLEMVPHLAKLGYTQDYGIHQDQSTPGILTQVLADGDISPADMTGVAGTYPQRDYVVQYAESSLDFLNRLAEGDGLFYFFEHGEGRETLLFADQNDACPTVGAYLYFGDNAEVHVPEWEYVKTFGRHSALFTGVATVRDYDFSTPSSSITDSANNASGTGEHYEFGLPAPTASEAERIARIRGEQLDAGWHPLDGSGNCGALKAGFVFRLSDDVRAGYDGEYLVTAIRHGAVRVVTPTNETFYYGNQFSAIPAAVPFRPARKTPKPHVSGPASAVVVGPAGQDPYVDQYGRIKVQFHWGRPSTGSGNTSVWMRVAQPYAGAQYGMSFLPGVGNEVIVDFLNGDPDRPVVIGSVYNGANTQPYNLPSRKAVSTIKTRSGELRFDDTLGLQEVSLSSGQDLTQSAAHDLAIQAGNDASVSGGHDMAISAPHQLALSSTNEVSVTTPKMTVSGNGLFNLVAPTSTASLVQQQVGELNRKTAPTAFLVVSFASVLEFNILSSYNCLAERLTPGVYRVSFRSSPANAYYAPVITPLSSSAQPLFANVIERKRDYFVFGIADKNGVATDIPFSAVVFGGF